MPPTAPLSLLLVMLMAFWTPMTQCCAATAEAAPAQPQTSPTPTPPCHPPQPADDRAPCEKPDADCTDACHCTPLLRNACKASDAPALAPAPSHPQPPAPTAALLPVGMLPSSHAPLNAPPPRDAGPPTGRAPSLIALSCQLTI